MAEAVCDFMPPSMVRTPAVLEDVDVSSVTAQEQSASKGQALADPLPLKEEFSPLHWYPPDQRQNRERIRPQLIYSAKTCNGKLQLGKQYT